MFAIWRHKGIRERTVVTEQNKKNADRNPNRVVDSFTRNALPVLDICIDNKHFLFVLELTVIYYWIFESVTIYPLIESLSLLSGFDDVAAAATAAAAIVDALV